MLWDRTTRPVHGVIFEIMAGCGPFPRIWIGNHGLFGDESFFASTPSLPSHRASRLRRATSPQPVRCPFGLHGHVAKARSPLPAIRCALPFRRALPRRSGGPVRANPPQGAWRVSTVQHIFILQAKPNRSSRGVFELPAENSRILSLFIVGAASVNTAWRVS